MSSATSNSELTIEQLLHSFETKIAEKEAALSTMQETLAEYKVELIKTAKELLRRETVVAARERELDAIAPKATAGDEAEKSVKSHRIESASPESKAANAEPNKADPRYPKTFDAEPLDTKSSISKAASPKKETKYVYVGHPLIENETDDWVEPQTRGEREEAAIKELRRQREEDKRKEELEKEAWAKQLEG